MHLSGYFEPNNSLDELGGGGLGGFPLDDDDEDEEEDEEEQIEIADEEVKTLKKDAGKPVGSAKQSGADKKSAGATKDAVGFVKETNIEKSLKDA